MIAGRLAISATSSVNPASESCGEDFTRKRIMASIIAGSSRYEFWESFNQTFAHDLSGSYTKGLCDVYPLVHNFSPVTSPKSDLKEFVATMDAE